MPWLTYYSHFGDNLPIRVVQKPCQKPQGPQQRQKMSQSRGDNRSDNHLHFHIGVPPFRICHIIYHISSDRSQVSNTSYISNSIRGNTVFACEYTICVKYSEVAHLLRKYRRILLLSSLLDCDNFHCCVIGQ